ALRLYEKFVDVPRSSPYRRMMEGRYEWLSRRILRDQVERIASQEPIGGVETSPQVVAVFPFSYQGTDDRYIPLARGLAEMVSVDLANIEEIRVVERIRLQVLLDELELSQSDYVDPSTAPRVGQLLGAGRLVSGSYNVIGKENLRMDGAFLELETSSVEAVNSQSDALRNLFLMQKAFVFSLVDQMGLILTPEEREGIEFIPTQNIQAFLAYSRGLREEDAGAYGMAAGFYRRASRLDPDFTIAKEAAERAETMDAADMDISELVAQSSDIESMNVLDVDLMGLRIGIMNNELGSGIIPGDESREPATETSGGGGILPDPPRPPSSPN
ncbi:MAG: CsgG/HfaB family protein, partial [Rhodothermaceae bacterium]|nr:CsgG/HfaB family protein [Rhodothermaceae bacterium]